jgi:hypothetical protein
VILKVTPSDDLNGLRKHILNFHRHNWIGGLFGLNHAADQKVLLFGYRFDTTVLALIAPKV